MMDTSTSHADLITLMPPSTSAWSLFGHRDLQAPFVQVKEGPGVYTLGWHVGHINNVMVVGLYLNRLDDEGTMQPCHETHIPAQPSFAVLNHMMDVFVADKGPGREPLKSTFDAIDSAPQPFENYNAVMRDETAFLTEILEQWCEPSDSLKHLAAELYLMITTDISMGLSAPGWTPPGPKGMGE